MTERVIVHLTDEASAAIDRFAVERGVKRVDAILGLIVIGNYVNVGLIEGKEFLVKEKGKVNYIDFSGMPPLLDN